VRGVFYSLLPLTGGRVLGVGRSATGQGCQYPCDIKAMQLVNVHGVVAEASVKRGGGAGVCSLFDRICSTRHSLRPWGRLGVFSLVLLQLLVVQDNDIEFKIVNGVAKGLSCL
jgi:hypothetical protein